MNACWARDPQIPLKSLRIRNQTKRSVSSCSNLSWVSDPLALAGAVNPNAWISLFFYASMMETVISSANGRPLLVRISIGVTRSMTNGELDHRHVAIRVNRRFYGAIAWTGDRSQVAAVSQQEIPALEHRLERKFLIHSTAATNESSANTLRKLPRTASTTTPISSCGPSAAPSLVAS